MLRAAFNQEGNEYPPSLKLLDFHAAIWLIAGLLGFRVSGGSGWVWVHVTHGSSRNVGISYFLVRFVSLLRNIMKNFFFFFFVHGADLVWTDTFSGSCNYWVRNSDGPWLVVEAGWSCDTCWCVLNWKVELAGALRVITVALLAICSLFSELRHARSTSKQYGSWSRSWWDATNVHVSAKDSNTNPNYSEGYRGDREGDGVTGETGRVMGLLKKMGEHLGYGGSGETKRGGGGRCRSGETGRAVWETGRVTRETGKVTGETGRALGVTGETGRECR